MFRDIYLVRSTKLRGTGTIQLTEDTKVRSPSFGSTFVLAFLFRQWSENVVSFDWFDSWRDKLVLVDQSPQQKFSIFYRASIIPGDWSEALGTLQGNEYQSMLC